MSLKSASVLLLRIVQRAFWATVAVSAFFVLTQDFQVFPLLARKFFQVPSFPTPDDVDVLTPSSSDGSRGLVWRLRAATPRPRVALIVHGNGEVVASFYRVQQWLASQGITTYSMEFRGYHGGDSGWPSERGLYADAEATFEMMLREEGIEASDAIVLGSSLGTGVASHIAARFHPKALVLFCPYTSLVDVVARYQLLGYLTPFMWYEFPSERNIKELRSTCVVAAHGRNDTVIPFEHSERLRRAYQGDATFTLLDSSEAGHNDIIGSVQHLVPGAIDACFGRTAS